MPTLPTFELPFKLPFDLPKVDLTSFDLSNLDLPTIDLPSAEQVIGFFRDATLAGTGLVSLTAEKIAELQKQLVGALQAQLEKVRAAA
jgi:hypothetical protein